MPVETFLCNVRVYLGGDPAFGAAGSFISLSAFAHFPSFKTGWNSLDPGKQYGINKVTVHGLKGSGFRGSKFNANLNRWTVKLEFWLLLWVENAMSWRSRLIHMQNGGIIRLRDPLKLIYSIRLKQKSNPEPLNPEPVNGYNLDWTKTGLRSHHVTSQ